MPTDLDQYELIFPCEYPVKLFGLDQDNFADFVLELLSRHVPGIQNTDLHTHSSKDGKYLAVSTTFTAQSREQVDALYADIGAHKRILFAM